jgi:hypothetical protein
MGKHRLKRTEMGGDFRIDTHLTRKGFPNPVGPDFAFDNATFRFQLGIRKLLTINIRIP